ncbi:hypothetical protein CLOM_g12390 [Closterium sp. NIES-68]|nr:hypothetical protein CLOM_g12390 [Closterium sp. NIES-68]GJP82845.1 hypothetical protein CLOP_g13072 [Closterium sp. NIES-67]
MAGVDGFVNGIREVGKSDRRSIHGSTEEVNDDYGRLRLEMAGGGSFGVGEVEEPGGRSRHGGTEEMNVGNGMLRPDMASAGVGGIGVGEVERPGGRSRHGSTEEVNADHGGLLPETEILTVCTPQGHARVRISPTRMGQTWRGWGTSLGWFANYIGKLPPDQLTHLLDLLFHPSKGLGLNLARYLIGGSFNPLLSPQFLTEACEAMAIPGYRVTASGPYDWSADSRQRRVLAGAIVRGVDEVEAVAYSPPWWMTVSGDTAGLSVGKTNLKKGYYLAYAGYLADVVAHFREQWNVTFSTLNPANEAMEGWWVRGNRQEGCNFNATELNMLVAHVVGTLKTRRILDRTGVAGFDSFAGRTLQNWEEFSPVVKSALSRINVHGYVPPPKNSTDARAYIEGKFGPLRKRAEALGKEVWVSEMGPLFVTGDDMAVTAFIARCIIQSVNILGASAWVFWQAINKESEADPSALNWGLFTIPYNRINNSTAPPLRVTLSRKYYMLQQFIQGAPKGSLPLNIEAANGCHHSIAAFFHPRRHLLSVFIVNQDAAEYNISLSISTFQVYDLAIPATVEVYRTSYNETGSLVSSANYEVVPSPFLVVAPGNSVTSVLISDVAVLH